MPLLELTFSSASIKEIGSRLFDQTSIIGMCHIEEGEASQLLLAVPADFLDCWVCGRDAQRRVGAHDPNRRIVEYRTPASFADAHRLFGTFAIGDVGRDREDAFAGRAIR